MFNLESLIVFGLSIITFAAVIVDAVRTRVKIFKLAKENKQLGLDCVIYMTQLAEMVEKRDVKTVEETNGFLKFVSDSRDWAFEYIEDVQQALRAYDIALGMDDAKVLNDAYKKLISFLPDDDVVN